ncbi:MAG: hypothetical protein QW511_05825 [Candidatus Methanomethylicia archaeon]
MILAILTSALAVGWSGNLYLLFSLDINATLINLSHNSVILDPGISSPIIMLGFLAVHSMMHCLQAI